MNNDLISRSELKKTIINICGNCSNIIKEYKDGVPDGNCAIQHIMNMIDNAPTVEYTFEEAFQKTVCEQRLYCPERPQGEWIPVSERLPEDRNLVLVTAYWHETYQVMQASYFGEGEKNGWWCVPWNNCGEHMRNDLHVIAWQPLPKPYKN